MRTPHIEISQKRQHNGTRCIEVLADGQLVSQLQIIPLSMHVGIATVRVAGISDVRTEEAQRKRGYARHLLEAAVQHMRQSTAALSFLYGIDEFYPKFGYTTIGPMYHLRITAMAYRPPLPEGWRMRSLRRRDLPAIKRIYALNTANSVGAAVRTARSPVWTQLIATAAPNSADTCRVIADEHDAVVAYAWRGAGLGYVRDFEGYEPRSLVLGEVMASSPQSADAILGLCCAWAAEETARREQPVCWVYSNQPPWSIISTAAMYHENWLDTQSFRSGGMMARTLSAGRLLSALQPELERRLHAAHSSFRGTLQIRTEEDSAILIIDGQHLEVHPEQLPTGQMMHVLDIAHTTLIRLALGVFPPTDILARLPLPPEERIAELLTALFPRRDIHLYMPDRP